MAKVFLKYVEELQNKLAENNAAINEIENNDYLSILGKQQAIEPLKEKANGFYVEFQKSVEAKISEYEPKFEYKELSAEAVSKIRDLMSIASSAGRTINDEFMTDLLSEYKAEYDLRSIANAVNGKEYPKAFAKELAFADKYNQFAECKEYIMQQASVRSAQSYALENLKSLEEYNNVIF